LVGEAFRNIDIIQNVTSPILFIHGTKDEMIKYQHSVDLHEKARPTKDKKRIKLVEGAPHDNWDVKTQISPNIKEF